VSRGCVDVANDAGGDASATLSDSAWPGKLVARLSAAQKKPGRKCHASSK